MKRTNNPVSICIFALLIGLFAFNSFGCGSFDANPSGGRVDIIIPTTQPTTKPGVHVEQNTGQLVVSRIIEQVPVSGNTFNFTGGAWVGIVCVIAILIALVLIVKKSKEKSDVSNERKSG